MCRWFIQRFEKHRKILRRIMNIYITFSFLWVPIALLSIYVIWGSMYGHPFEYHFHGFFEKFCRIVKIAITPLIINSIVVISIWGISRLPALIYWSYIVIAAWVIILAVKSHRMKRPLLNVTDKEWLDSLLTRIPFLFLALGSGILPLVLSNHIN